MAGAPLTLPPPRTRESRRAADRPLQPQRQAPHETGPSWLRGGTVPALDGLRALSIVLVLLGHASLTWGGNTPGQHGPLARLGGVGVDLFFVISGFLITLLMLREHQQAGAISLRAFYVRRAWRILPPYFAFLLCLFVLRGAGLVQLAGRDWAGAFTYTVNFLPGTSWPVGHLWSLSVEEHFYLVWPLLLVLAGPLRGCALAAGYVALAPGLRLAIYHARIDALDLDYCTPARMDTIALGCLLAFAANHPAARRWIAIPSPRRAGMMALLLLGMLILSNAVLVRSGFYAITVRRTVDGLCFAGLVWAAASHADGALARLLNARPFVWLGRLSYGLYLWQQPFLDPHGEAWMCRWPVNLGLSVLAALVCFVLVEQPALRLRARYGWGRVSPAASAVWIYPSARNVTFPKWAPLSR